MYIVQDYDIIPSSTERTLILTGIEVENTCLKVIADLARGWVICTKAGGRLKEKQQFNPTLLPDKIYPMLPVHNINKK